MTAARWDCDHVMFLPGGEPPKDMTKDKIMSWKKHTESLVANLAIMIGIAQDYNKGNK